jgi:hypothetical protein
MGKIVVPLNEEQLSQLKQQALEEGVSTAEVIRRALRNYSPPVLVQAPVPVESPVYDSAGDSYDEAS